jgi:hypothetical protein
LPLSKADDADRIIATARFLAKHPAMDGMFGPMSGTSSGRQPRLPLIADNYMFVIPSFMRSFRGVRRVESEIGFGKDKAQAAFRYLSLRGCARLHAGRTRNRSPSPNRFRVPPRRSRAGPGMTTSDVCVQPRNDEAAEQVTANECVA